jgi:aspartyl-tRNA(Asn)/glutamyl-tRNA(Gln) amidotransferase subunit A
LPSTQPTEVALHELTLTELSVELTAKRVSSREIVDTLLERIAKADAKPHAFAEVYATEARALADALTPQSKEG